jgi:hypothetical protein
MLLKNNKCGLNTDSAALMGALNVLVCRRF